MRKKTLVVGATPPVEGPQVRLDGRNWKITAECRPPISPEKLEATSAVRVRFFNGSAQAFVDAHPLIEVISVFLEEVQVESNT